MVRTVGIGDYALSGNPEDTIVTHSLASCVAVTAYSPSKKAAGMVHILLPSPQMDQEQSLGPCYFAITGIPFMINRLCLEYGCLKNGLTIRMFGGANSVRADDVFCLGKKNIQAAAETLINMNLMFEASETGALISRSLEMDVATGRVLIKSQPITI